MNKFAILFTSFVGMIGLLTPQSINVCQSDNRNINQANYQNSEEVLVKPVALAPTYKIQNENSDIIFITDYFAPNYFSNLRDNFGNNTFGFCGYVSIGDRYQHDYHWYRQNSDGTWSHKPGTTAVRRTDNSGNHIIDPETCDRGLYTNFLGFYAVTPWNNLYQA